MVKQIFLSDACKKIFKCTQNIMHFQSSLKFAYLAVMILKNKFLFHSITHYKNPTQKPTVENAGSV